MDGLELELHWGKKRGRSPKKKGEVGGGSLRSAGGGERGLLEDVTYPIASNAPYTTFLAS